MSKLLGIDFGLKRVGIAETDEMQIIASPLITIPTKEIFSFLTKYLKSNKVELVVLGYPTKLDGTDTDITDDVRKFKAKIENTFQLKVALYDERFSSKMASAAIAQSGLSKKKREDKSLVDKVSATIILRDFMGAQN